MNYKDYIVINSQVRFGKPVLKETRIAVVDVLNWLANGLTKEEIIQDYPELTMEHIDSCLHYAASREGLLRSIT